MPTLAELLKTGSVRLGRAENVACTNAAGGTLILGHNPRRVAFVIANNEANAARATRGGIVPTTSIGVPIDANGGVMSQRFEDVGEAVGLALRAILATAAGNLYVEEYEAV